MSLLSIRTGTWIGILFLMVGTARTEVPDFEKDIAPILEAKCLSCHNAADAKGEFVLETREQALSDPEMIAPGSSADSKLMSLISGGEPDMPKRGVPLSEKQIQTVGDWIKAGAKWPEARVLRDNPERDLNWWSLAPIQEGLIDQLTGLNRMANPVDFFINRKLDEKKLVPVDEAEPAILIRRLTYDLTGLPPTPDEVDAFLKNPDWPALVDRLLASPEFGEKFASHWLDLARYAETHGYDKDKPRMNAWPYRDYVIRSFNEDKPYGRFVREQVAGDVLYPGEPDGVIGLGFLAAGPWDLIGHQEVGEAKLDGRIAKHLDRDEMVSAVFNVFQSSTVQCAQCHHHKFDPILMEDYYRLHAVFAAVDRADRVYDGISAAEQKRKNELNAKISLLRQEQEKLDTTFKRLLAGKVSGIDRRIAELKEKYGTGIKPQYGYHSHIEKKQETEKWVQLDLGQPRFVTEIQLIPAYDQFGGIGEGFGFPVRYRVEVSNDGTFQKDVRTLRDATGKDQPNPGSDTITIDGDGNAFRFLRVTAMKLAERTEDYIFALGEVETLNEGGAVNYAAGENVAVTALDSIESGPRWGKANLVDGIFFRALGNDEALAELKGLEDAREKLEKETRPPGSAERLAAIKTEMEELNKDLKAIPTGPVVFAAATHFPRQGRFTATDGNPRAIHLLHRGDLRTPGEEMDPGAPPLWKNVRSRFSEESGADESQARKELAQYLTSRENPLVWRSIANRLVQWTLGRPMVGTPNDFGRGGMTPTHPELLDFLAACLRNDPDQSLKSVIRMLVTSDAYRRSSTHHESNAALDGDNLFFWRADRRRLSAEEFRDSVLAVSGALQLDKRDGPGFQDFVIEKPQHSPHYEYHLHDPENPESHRRTVFRFVVRSQPQPMLTTLDCADPSMSVAQRDESTTALQALTQWNHQFVEAMSRRFAKRLKEEAGETVDEKVALACRLALGRLPSEDERSILSDLLQKEGAENFARVVFNMNAFVYVD